jgi:prolyl 4-hydroxylase
MVDLCKDKDPDCSEFADRGECDKNPSWMLDNCKKSCGACETAGQNHNGDQEEAEGNGGQDDGVCKDNHKNCEFWAEEGECKQNPKYMLENCKKACKVCPETQVECQDKHPSHECRSRRDEGECEKNPGWMIVMCAKTCNKCDLLLQKKRCVPEVFQDPDYVYEDAVKGKGDLTRIFEKVIREYPKTQVLLQPPKGPWIVSLPDFITPLERETLLNLTLPHVKRSTDQGSFNAVGIQEQIVSQGRTSSNAWCMGGCAENEIVVGLTQRVASLITVPLKNFESYQVLQYKKDQKYDVHHDSSDDDLDDMAGPRVLTFFMYLSEVEEGGETWFDKLDLKVKPQTGMAILWPSVLDEDPSKIDWRTTHAALPVIKGVKLAANLWVHMRDFNTPNLWGCTGSFD